MRSRVWRGHAASDFLRVGTRQWRDPSTRRSAHDLVQQRRIARDERHIVRQVSLDQLPLPIAERDMPDVMLIDDFDDAVRTRLDVIAVVVVAQISAQRGMRAASSPGNCGRTRTTIAPSSIC